MLKLEIPNYFPLLFLAVTNDFPPWSIARACEITKIHIIPGQRARLSAYDEGHSKRNQEMNILLRVISIHRPVLVIFLKLNVKRRGFFKKL